jgi:pyrimidine operon attenuation protein/uracil phosphoribosyltransferase
MPDRKYILNEEVVTRKLQRMAYEIVENNLDESKVILAGIRENGTVIAKYIEKIISEISSLKAELITISLDKRVFKEVKLDKDIDFNNQVVVIIDDVVNSGRTLLYALKPFLQFQPKKIQTLVLVERTHKNFPVQADYVGLSISTTLQEHITVEVDGEKITGAYLH